MPNTNAYTRMIQPVGYAKDEYVAVHQVSPSWVLTFVRWNVRDTIRAQSASNTINSLLQVRRPLVVENDCVELNVNVNKSVHTPSMSAVLKETDENYSTAIAPGDFVFVNMLNWESQARTVASKGRGTHPGAINGINDGFKGFFKVQSVRKSMITDPNTGTKVVFIKITGFAFTEFNNMIYFNPYLQDTDIGGSDRGAILFAQNLSALYANLISPTANTSCQDMLKILIQGFIGTGLSDIGGTTQIKGSPVTANPHFYIPQQVGALLGISGVTSAADIYNYLFGIQQYSSNQSQTLANGMNPVNISSSLSTGRFTYTGDYCRGQLLLKAEYWNQVNTWSILNQYTNSPVNELYTCFRVNTAGLIMPTVVFRQIPFSTDYFGTPPFNVSASVTKFSNLPRWKINSSLVLSTDIGRDEAGRINFVQYYVRPSSNGAEQAFIAAQTESLNFTYDINDVSRSGLRPMVIQTSFEELSIQNNINIGRICAVILGDSLIGGQLKLNGTLECAGIVDPIAVGDNLEYDGTVYHIEEVVHSCHINADNGVRVFRTIIKVSNGVSLSSAGSGLQYAEMTHTNAYQDRKDNYTYGNQTVPGISEDQDVIYRPTSPAPTQQQINALDKPFAQPGQTVLPIIEDENENDSGSGTGG